MMLMNMMTVYGCHDDRDDDADDDDYYYDDFGDGDYEDEDDDDGDDGNDADDGRDSIDKNNRTVPHVSTVNQRRSCVFLVDEECRETGVINPTRFHGNILPLLCHTIFPSASIACEPEPLLLGNECLDSLLVHKC